MARLPRVVVADVAHHVTQRGNARQFLLASDCERKEEKLVYRPVCPRFSVRTMLFRSWQHHGPVCSGVTGHQVLKSSRKVRDHGVGADTRFSVCVSRNPRSR